MGASKGRDPKFEQAAKELGQAIVACGHTVVYGGGNTGLMGALADSVLEAKGEITGVITPHLHAIEGHKKVKMIFCDHIEDRIKTMIDMSDAFIGLPGGYGTLEEMLKVLNGAKLKLHNKPIGFLNTENFYALLFQLIDHVTEAGFAKKAEGKLYHASASAVELLSLLFPSKKIGFQKDLPLPSIFNPAVIADPNADNLSSLPIPIAAGYSPPQ